MKQMLSIDVLDIVLEESETMVIEWADTQSGFGFDKIHYKLMSFFTEEQIKEDVYTEIVKRVRNLIKTDMELMEW